MTFFSNKNNFKLSGLALSALASILTACGGGGGGGSEGPPPPPPRSEFIAVTSVNPADKAIDIDAQTGTISVSFSENIDPSSFIKESTALGRLIAAKATPAVNGSKIDKLIDAAGSTVDVVQTQLTIAQMASRNLSIVGSCANVVQGAANVITGTLKISGYRFVAEEVSGLHALHLFVENCSEPFVFGSAEIINSGLVNNNMFKVELISGSTSQVVAAMGQISVSGKTITFTPVNFLEWSSETKPAEYRITVKRDAGNTDATQGIKELLPAGSTERVRTLQADFVSTFKTKVLPEAKVVSTSPNGINASPVAVIKAVTNFKVDAASLNSATVKLERINRTSNDPSVPVTRTAVATTLAYDVGQSEIVITPVGDLRYLQEYEVTIVGGTGGLRGSMGNVLGRFMADAGHKFSFTTAEAKVMSVTATNSVPTSANGEATLFKVKLNFKPDVSTIPAGLVVMNTTTGTEVVYSTTVSNDEITVKPSVALQYGHSYQVTVKPELKSQALRGQENEGEPLVVSLATASTTTIAMESRQVTSVVPTLASSISETSSLIYSFNFDVDTILNQTVIEVSQVSNGTTGAADVFVSAPSRRVIEIKPRSKFPFRAVLTVNIRFPVLDGRSVSVPAQTFTVAPSNTLAVTGKTPTGSSVSLISEISVSFSHNIETLTSSQKNSSSSDAALKLSIVGSASGCGYYNGSVGGRITQDSNRIYFLPSAGLKSWCKYKVEINKNLVSTDGRTRAGDESFEFTANGLQVNNVYVTYAYGTKVSVRQPIEVLFNYDLASFQWSDAVTLTNVRTGSNVSVSTSIWDNEFTLDPYFDLDYNTQYKLTVKSGSYGVEGEDEETLASDYVVYFTTEELPLNVDNYGPVGTVRTDTRFFIEYDRSVNTPGFPLVTATLDGYSQTVSNDGLYTFSFKPTSGLTPGGYDYRPKFFWNDESFTWTVRSAATASAASRINNHGVMAPQSKAIVSSVLNTYLASPILAKDAKNGEIIVNGLDFAESCARRSDCVGELRSGTETRYRQLTLRGLTKADIGHKAQDAARRAAR